MAGMTVKINDAGLKRKVSAQAFRRGMVELADQAAADMNHFVPYKNGHLSGSSNIASDGSQIQWRAPYAHYQWVGGVGWHYTTPGTGPKWNEKAKAQYMDAWRRAFIKGAGL